MTENRAKIFISGRVQGVGFRPAAHRIAEQLGLAGFVYNDTRGVTIELQGQKQRVDEFLERLRGSDRPPLARMKTCEVQDIPPVEGASGFTILKSKSEGTALSEVSADVAACEQCLAEMRDRNDLRYRYPFINCTNCGPRYSIVKTIPYDRPNTTMAVFAMCPRCKAQYEDISDRRFHAQPVACPECGPAIWLADNKGATLERNGDGVVSLAARILRDGKVVAIKGVGGFHLAVDAANDEAVRRLRQRKRRDYKPFAMMADSIETIRRCGAVDEAAENLLRSPESPIVLLPKRGDSGISPATAHGVGTFGFMLPYAPLHHLLFAEGPKVLVMTSGNISDEPLICRNDDAIAKLGDVADAFLMHNRDIYRQVDDSILHFVDAQPAILRRSRGYVPMPMLVSRSCPRDIFAAGSDLKNTFSFVKHNQLICSEHIGDLEDAEVYHHYINSIEHLSGLFEVKPETVACDLHPGYLSTQYAKARQSGGVIEVQHHWAHIAAVMAEHGQEERVIGLACDGTGYGTDGAIWGCECLIADLQRFERFGHLAYYPLAGGDAASKEAIRPLLGLLSCAYGREFDLGKFGWLLGPIEPDANKQRVILEQISRGVNAVPTSSLGRVFDAVAALAGLGSYNHFEAQLPMELESIAEPGNEDLYEFDLVETSGIEIDLRRMMRQLADEVKAGVARAALSAKFHNTIAAALLETARMARERTSIDTAALSGGVFCNRFLANRVISLLKRDGFRVLFNYDYPANDGCVSVGQAAIAARLITKER